jgi:hypothetical protein
VNALSLCSGIGGLDLGLTWAGWTIAGQVEIDPWCRSVLAAHWPGVPRHDDIRTAAAWWTSAPRPAIDLICGGIPCQPHSAVGRRLGVTDPRWLWPPFAHVVAALRPALVLIENVPLSGSMRGGAVSPQPPLVRRISGGASSSLLPTPTAQDHLSNRGGAAGRAGKIRLTLAGMARYGVWHPIDAATRPYAEVIAELQAETPCGKLNPQWVEWLMGLPPGWTGSTAWETPSSPRSRSTSPA